MTDAERALWQHLRMRQLDGHKFRRQQPIGNYIVDFVCFEKKLIVEVDGGQHVEQQAHDQKRDAWLESQGFRMLRFWNHEVLKERESVKEVIVQALDTPTLILPHKGGGNPGKESRKQEIPSPLAGEGQQEIPSPLVGEGQDGGAFNEPESKVVVS